MEKAVEDPPPAWGRVVEGESSGCPRMTRHAPRRHERHPFGFQGREASPRWRLLELSEVREPGFEVIGKGGEGGIDVGRLGHARPFELRAFGGGFGDGVGLELVGGQRVAERGVVEDARASLGLLATSAVKAVSAS